MVYWKGQVCLLKKVILLSFQRNAEFQIQLFNGVIKVLHMEPENNINSFKKKWHMSSECQCNGAISNIPMLHMLQIERKDGPSKMAHLPKEICTEAVQFTYCGVDMFGSLIIKEKIRNQTLYCPFHLFLQIYSINWSHQFTWCWFLYHVKERSSLFNMVKQWPKFCWCQQWIEKGI